MSVLQQLIRDREVWISRRNLQAIRHYHIRIILEFTLFVIAGLVLYCYHDNIVAFIRWVLPDLGV
jgi:hypothetical protein